MFIVDNRRIATMRELLGEGRTVLVTGPMGMPIPSDMVVDSSATLHADGASNPSRTPSAPTGGAFPAAAPKEGE